MKVKTILIFLAAVLLFNSCSNHFAQIMLRPFDDPKDDEIYVDSFSQIHKCTVSWKEDPCADLYILMRKEKAATNFKEVYRGTQTEYEDTDLNNSQAYIYRLDKMRGTKPFTGTKLGYGVSSSIVNDSFENNDTLENATYLDTSCNCNTYYCDFGNYKLIDYDCFYIILKPQKQAQLEISGNPGDSFLIEDGLKPGYPIAGNENFSITNNSFENKKIYFRVSLAGSSTNYKEVNYVIKIANETPLQP
jgi:hypothetical protein